MDNENICKYSDEEWRDVIGYEGFYKVSNYGRIMSLHENTKLGKNGGCILKPHVRETGYESVTLYDNNGRHAFLVHRLVAMAFLPNPNNYPAVNHKDECKRNNKSDNLEWCTIRYNNCYGTAKIRQALTMGRPVVQMNMMGMVIAKYKTISVAEEMLGLCSISDAIKNNYQCGGYIWRYLKDNEF